jgi:hypothetical protein
VTCVGLKCVRSGGSTGVRFETAMSEIGHAGSLVGVLELMVRGECYFAPGRDYLLKLELEEVPK